VESSFEAGFINAFQVKILPEDADPMDLRYNVINWVHRATRGWSFGIPLLTHAPVKLREMYP
jgi:hypothetical protein